MAKRKGSNYPAGQLGALSGKEVAAVVDNVRTVSAFSMNGKPKDIEELKERIGKYFQYCSEKEMRPGIEGISLALGVSRSTFWSWCKGVSCSPEWARVCGVARQCISAFIEQAGMSGLISPVVQIWLQKNHDGYKDNTTVEHYYSDLPRTLSIDELPLLGEIVEERDADSYE